MGFWGNFNFNLVLFFVLSFSITIKVFGGESSNFLDNFEKKIVKVFSYNHLNLLLMLCRKIVSGISSEDRVTLCLSSLQMSQYFY